MHDWRHDPDVQHVTHSDRLGTYEELQVRSGPNVGALNPDQLRTVPMPDLRSAAARDLDAAARELPPLTYAERTDAKLDALWLALQALRGTVDSLRQEQARTIAELTAYIRDHSEGEE